MTSSTIDKRTTYKAMSKDERETLRKAYEASPLSGWGNCEHYVKQTSNYFEADDGTIVTFDKPTIQTSFWLGERGSEDRTGEAARNERSVHYFIEQNMRQCRSYRTDLGRSGDVLYIKRGAYNRQSDECPLGTATFGDCFGNDFWGKNLEADGYRRLTEDEVSRLCEAEDRQRALFEKRLRTYLKRYGLSKVSCSTFWADR